MRDMNWIVKQGSCSDIKNLQEKRVYSAPQLRNYGKAEELTLGCGEGFSDGSGEAAGDPTKCIGPTS